MKPHHVILILLALAAGCDEPKTQAEKTPAYSGGPMPLREAEMVANRCQAGWTAADEDEQAVQKHFRAAVLQMLADPLAEGRRSATAELIELRNPRAMEAFYLAGGPGEPDAKVRAAAIRAMGDMGKSADALTIAAGLKDAAPEVRLAAAEALAKLRNPKTIEVLIQSLNDDSDEKVRTAAARALGWIRDPSAVPSLIAVLKYGSPQTRAAAAASLGLINDSRAVSPLITVLKDDSPLVRFQAANALGQLRDIRAVPALKAGLKDPDVAVRNAVQNALNQLNAKP